jgi:hypothetical protein
MKTMQVFSSSVIVVALLSCVISTEAQQAKYKMTTDIPTSITTPDVVETSIGTLRFFD